MLHLAKSHTKPLLHHDDVYDASNLLTRGQTITALAETGADSAGVVSGVLPPGTMSLHHLCTAHGGGPNTATTRRIGFNVTYCAGHVSTVLICEQNFPLEDDIGSHDCWFEPSVRVIQ
jgi:hypothetical protein